MRKREREIGVIVLGIHRTTTTQVPLSIFEQFGTPEGVSAALPKAHGSRSVEETEMNRPEAKGEGCATQACAQGSLAVGGRFLLEFWLEWGLRRCLGRVCLCLGVVQAKGPKEHSRVHGVFCPRLHSQ